MIGLVFVSIVGYKVFTAWNKTQEAQYAVLHKKDFDRDFLELQAKYDTAQKAADNWKHRYRLLQRNYDITVNEDELDYDLEDPEIPEEDKLSDLVAKLWPNIPKPITKILDKPELQQKLADYASKNPEGVIGLIDNFVKKSPKKEQVPSSNITEYGI